MTKVIEIKRTLDGEIKSLIEYCQVMHDGLQVSDLSFASFLGNNILKSMVVRQGIPYKLFMLIYNWADFSFDEWAELINFTKRSLFNYRDEGLDFKPIQSEKIIAVAEVTMAGLKTFRSKGKFKAWLKTPNEYICNQKPFHLIKDSYGKDIVLTELHRMKGMNDRYY